MPCIKCEEQVWCVKDYTEQCIILKQPGDYYHSYADMVGGIVSHTYCSRYKKLCQTNRVRGICRLITNMISSPGLLFFGSSFICLPIDWSSDRQIVAKVRMS
ncbi:hypothetical protein BDV32DRAFT_125482 [Aspergillus pseudonomiae]|nr:hypothetical protein BDV32DRAFT_125482 [Aspergillus pseudonomiae]